MMSSRARDDRPYSVFVSYSRRDDVGGWVTELVAALRREFERSGDPDFRVFFDRSDIRTLEEWRSKLRWALRQAPVMVVCTSNEYFSNDPCLWEFLEYDERTTQPEEIHGLVPVLLEDSALAGTDEIHERWQAQVLKMQGKLDLQGMFSREPERVSRDDLGELVAQLPDFVISEAVRGNPEEVGRRARQELVRRTATGDHLLLVLDNVDRVSLFGGAQLRELLVAREFHAGHF